MTVEFHPLASAELAEAIDRYRDVSVELAMRFADEVDVVLDDIANAPERWSFYEPLARERRWRRCFTTGFPHLVVYEVRNDTIRVIAFSHASRRPGYWADRD